MVNIETKGIQIPYQVPSQELERIDRAEIPKLDGVTPPQNIVLRNDMYEASIRRSGGRKRKKNVITFDSFPNGFLDGTNPNLKGLVFPSPTMWVSSGNVATSLQVYTGLNKGLSLFNPDVELNPDLNDLVICTCERGSWDLLSLDAQVSNYLNFAFEVQALDFNDGLIAKQEFTMNAGVAQTLNFVGFTSIAKVKFVKTPLPEQTLVPIEDQVGNGTEAYFTFTNVVVKVFPQHGLVPNIR